MPIGASFRKVNRFTRTRREMCHCYFVVSVTVPLIACVIRARSAPVNYCQCSTNIDTRTRTWRSHMKLPFAIGAASALVLAASVVRPAVAGEQKLHSVYWVDGATCRATAQPTSVTKSGGPEGVTVSLRHGSVPIGPKQPNCQGRSISGAWVVARGRGAGSIFYEVHYSAGQSSSHTANVDLR
jgi:hypothetical protein